MTPADDFSDHVALPSLSDGVLLSAFGDGAAAYDLATDQVSILDTVAGWLLQSADEPIRTLVAEAVEATAAHADVVEVDIARGVAELVDAGLMVRTERRPELLPPDLSPPDLDSAEASSAINETTTDSASPLDEVGAVASDRAEVAGRERQPRSAADGRFISAVHAVLDERLVFRSSDRDLLDEIDARVVVSTTFGQPTIVFDVEPTDDGGVVLLAADEWRFGDRRGFFVQLPGVINDFASHCRTMLVLHAGAVRTPDGRILVMPGVPEAGKSTLTAALLQEGCDYLGDEMVGIREDSLQVVGFPQDLVLDETSREVLGLADTDQTNPHVNAWDLRSDVDLIEGEAGPVAQIVLPTFAGTADAPSEDALDPTDALRTLLTAVMNLDCSREIGWRTLCALAAQVPVTRVTHNSSPDLARSLVVPPDR